MRSGLPGSPRTLVLRRCRYTAARASARFVGEVEYETIREVKRAVALPRHGKR